MAIGNQTSVGGLNVQLGDCAVSMRDSCEQIQHLWSFIVSLGANEAAQVAGLVTLGFQAADAQNFWTDANYLFALNQFYYGQLASPAVFNYDSGLASARGAS
jgi:hypothetical protein